jgi:DNA-binding NtrC family response regulator
MPSPSATTSPSRTTLLLIDDDKDTVETFETLLRMSGYAVIPAYSVPHALELLDDHPEIALVISDIRMPGVDGLDLVRVLRHRFPTLKTILMSGAPITDNDVVPREAAVILTKPVSLEQLERAIAETLRSR